MMENQPLFDRLGGGKRSRFLLRHFYAGVHCVIAWVFARRIEDWNERIQTIVGFGRIKVRDPSRCAGNMPPNHLEWGRSSISISKHGSHPWRRVVESTGHRLKLERWCSSLNVTKKDGQTMHFDVMVPEGTPQGPVLEFANTYLSSVGEAGQECAVDQCRFCHVEHARPQVERSIRKSGYYIFEMEGCR